MADDNYDYVVRFAEYATPTTWTYIGGTLGKDNNPTSASDTPASTYIPNNFLSMPSFRIMLFNGIEPKAEPVLSAGSLVLANADGHLDQYMTTRVWDGGTLEIRRGAKGAAVSTFTLIASFTTGGYKCTGDQFEVIIRDLSWFLKQSPLHEKTFTGGGSEEGVSSMAGILKPYTVGFAYNITPTLIDDTLLIYAVSTGAIQDVSSVREGGIDWTWDGINHANYAALAGATIAASNFSTCRSLGLIRLGSSPVYNITCNIHGDTGAVVSSVSKRGSVASRILTGSAPALSSGQVSSSDVSALNTAHPAQVGYYWNERVSKADALSKVMNGIMGYWYVDLTGVVRLGYISKPTGTAAVTYTFPHQCDMPTLVAYQTPRYKTRVSADELYTIQDVSSLAPGAPDFAKLFYSRDGGWKEASTATQRTYWPTAPVVDVFGGFFDPTDAQTEADRQQALFQGYPTDSRNIELYSMPINVDGIVLAGYLGQIVSIAGMNRFGWSNPRKFVLVGVDWLGDLVTTAYLWG